MQEKFWETNPDFYRYHDPDYVLHGIILIYIAVCFIIIITKNVWLWSIFKIVDCILLLWRIFFKRLLSLSYRLKGFILLLNNIDYRKVLRRKPLPFTDLSKKVLKKTLNN